jgi:SAM-dependent methyltransferase
VIRRRREVHEARWRWVFGPTRLIARLIDSQTAMAAMTPRVSRIVSLIELAPGKRYLDIGCGTAAFAHLIAVRAGCDEPPITMDLVPAPGPIEIVGSPEHLPFADASVDCITSLYFIRRFTDDTIQIFAQELRRILAPGGAILLLEIAPVRNGLLNRFHGWLTSGGCSKVDLRGWGRLAALFTEAGFDAIDLVNVGPFIVPPVPRVGVLLRLASAPDAPAE